MTIQGAKEETSWKASQGWTWIVAQLIWIFICTKVLLACVQFNHAFGKWLIAHPITYNTSVTVLTDIWLLLAAYLCAKTKSVSDFINGLNLNKRPARTDLFYILSAICLGLVSVIGAMGGLAGGNWLSALYAHHGGWVWSFDVIYVCSITPFAEEVAKRGFLYRAFRNSYGMFLSIALVTCWDLFVHWQIASHSFFNFAIYSSFTIFICIVREKTASIWNCIFCHAVYNAATSKQWLICIFVFLIFLIFIFKNKIRQPVAEAKI